MSNFTNLAFKGGGVLGIAYAGAIQVLQDQNILQNIQRVAGTSAGAITAALVSLKYTAEEIYSIVQSTDFKSFEDGFDPLRIATKYGMYEGDAFLTWMQTQITAKGLASTATFADLKAKGMLDLHVFATDLNAQGLKQFSYETTPNVVVAEAVRASMSIPLFFEAWSFTNNNPDNHIYVDGGMIYNFPITIFDNGSPNEQTLGVYLQNLGPAPPPSGLTHDHVLQYVRDLFDTMMDAQVVDFDNDPEEKSRTIVIDNLGISATNFGLTDDQKTALYNSGKKYATAYLTPVAPAV
ncbi:MAG TPA: patatin-like phospholipase family protein [Bacteroidia bacterium]|nr:patatin-like phospholipase family protein [Bacteroidia bacterium]